MTTSSQAGDGALQQHVQAEHPIDPVSTAISMSRQQTTLRSYNTNARRPRPRITFPPSPAVGPRPRRHFHPPCVFGSSLTNRVCWFVSRTASFSYFIARQLSARRRLKPLWTQPGQPTRLAVGPLRHHPQRRAPVRLPAGCGKSGSGPTSSDLPAQPRDSLVRFGNVSFKASRCPDTAATH